MNVAIRLSILNRHSTGAPATPFHSPTLRTLVRQDISTKFNWPRVTNPKLSFPLTQQTIEETIKLEKMALGEIKDAITQHGPYIAALIIEPIQGEGGDNHFRNEFFIELRTICDENDILFVMDEVQSGVGLTGKFWAHEHFQHTA